jgi:transposase-like protein
MAKQKRKCFSAEEKVRILRRHLIDKIQVSDLCDECGFHPTAFYRWQKAFFENGKTAFAPVEDSQARKLEDKVRKLEAQLARKDEVIAEIMADHVQLKKSLGED